MEANFPKMAYLRYRGSVTQVSQIRKMSQSWHELSYCTSTWQLDLSNNLLGGYYDDDDNFVSDPSGVKELAGALAVNTSITQACQIWKVMVCGAE